MATRQASVAAAGKTNVVVEPGRQEIFVSRLFDAPLQRIFKAMTDPELIPQWWGPAIYTTTVDRLEAQPGGRWRFVQKDDEGHVYGFHGVFHEVAPARTVMTFEYEGVPGNVVLQITSLEDANGKTLLRQHLVFESVDARDGMVETGMEKGQNESLDRLEALASR